MRNQLYTFAAITLLAALLTGCASTAMAQGTTPEPAAAPAQPRTLTVSGSGKIYMTPDIAYITIGVHTEGAEATKAVEANNTQADKVITTLKSAGIDAKDIQTTNFSIYPQAVYDDQGKPTGEIKYSVDNSVYVTVRDITKVGDVLDAVVKAGANNISGIQFDVADKTAALTNARQAAVKDAQAKAAELAGAAGVALGPVQTISEYTSGGPQPMYDMRAAPMAAEAAASVPVQAGQMLLTVEVNLVYEIR